MFPRSACCKMFPRRLRGTAISSKRGNVSPLMVVRRNVSPVSSFANVSPSVQQRHGETFGNCSGVQTFAWNVSPSRPSQNVSPSLPRRGGGPGKSEMFPRRGVCGKLEMFPRRCRLQKCFPVGLRGQRGNILCKHGGQTFSEFERRGNIFGELEMFPRRSNWLGITWWRRCPPPPPPPPPANCFARVRFPRRRRKVERFPRRTDREKRPLRG